jgi:hypothetical protein
MINDGILVFHQKLLEFKVGDVHDCTSSCAIANKYMFCSITIMLD